MSKVTQSVLIALMVAFLTCTVCACTALPSPTSLSYKKSDDWGYIYGRFTEFHHDDKITHSGLPVDVVFYANPEDPATNLLYPFPLAYVNGELGLWVRDDAVMPEFDVANMATLHIGGYEYAPQDELFARIAEALAGNPLSEDDKKAVNSPYSFSGVGSVKVLVEYMEFPGAWYYPHTMLLSITNNALHIHYMGNVYSIQNYSADRLVYKPYLRAPTCELIGNSIDLSGIQYTVNEESLQYPCFFDHGGSIVGSCIITSREGLQMTVPVYRSLDGQYAWLRMDPTIIDSLLGSVEESVNSHMYGRSDASASVILVEQGMEFILPSIYTNAPQYVRVNGYQLSSEEVLLLVEALQEGVIQNDDVKVVARVYAEFKEPMHITVCELEIVCAGMDYYLRDMVTGKMYAYSMMRMG